MVRQLCQAGFCLHVGGIQSWLHPDPLVIYSSPTLFPRTLFPNNTSTASNLTPLLLSSLLFAQIFCSSLSLAPSSRPTGPTSRRTRSLAGALFSSLLYAMRLRCVPHVAKPNHSTPRHTAICATTTSNQLIRSLITVVMHFSGFGLIELPVMPSIQCLIFLVWFQLLI